MNKEQIERLEAVLKVLEKASWTNITLGEQLINTRIINDYARTIKELKDQLNKENA